MPDFMSVEREATKISTKLKLVMELREHLHLSPEEYRLLLQQVVREHLASVRAPREDTQKAA